MSVFFYPHKVINYTISIPSEDRRYDLRFSLSKEDDAKRISGFINHLNIDRVGIYSVKYDKNTYELEIQLYIPNDKKDDHQEWLK